MATKKVELFTGREDVTKFTTKCDLHCSLKGYDGEKKAAFIAGRLEEPAFDVYMALSDADKKDPEKIKEALINTFDNAKRNREVALEELTHRKRLQNEKAEVFAHKVLELVKYAYPKFTDDAKKSLAKDHFVKGLPSDIQKELRKVTDFETKGLDELVTLTTYYEITDANATATGETPSESIAVASVPSNTNNFDSRMDKLLSVMERSLGVCDDDDVRDHQPDNINYAGGSNSRNSRNRNRRNFNPGRGKYSGRGGNSSQQQPPKCRACNNTGHVVRNCPERFCQSCGNKGHDRWDRECPKYQ